MAWIRWGGLAAPGWAGLRDQDRDRCGIGIGIGNRGVGWEWSGTVGPLCFVECPTLPCVHGVLLSKVKHTEFAASRNISPAQVCRPPAGMNFTLGVLENRGLMQYANCPLIEAVVQTALPGFPAFKCQ